MKTRGNHLWNIILPALLLLLATETVRGQEAEQHRGTAESQLWLTLGCEPSYGVARDQGVSPRTYQTPGMGTYCAVALDNDIWRYQLDVALSGHILCRKTLPLSEVDPSGYGANVHLGLRLDRQVLQRNEWRLWVGGGVEDWLAIDYNDRYMNACVGMGNLSAPTLSFRGELRMDWMTLTLAAGAAPCGWWYRPGYAYLSNYTTGESEIEAFADNYESHIAIFPLLNSEAGVLIALSSGNTLGIIYHWNFLTSRDVGPWRYEAAHHSMRIALSIGF